MEKLSATAGPHEFGCGTKCFMPSVYLAECRTPRDYL